jgi:hypothetical protein
MGFDRHDRRDDPSNMQPTTTTTPVEFISLPISIFTPMSHLICHDGIHCLQRTPPGVQAPCLLTVLQLIYERHNKN